LAMLNAARAQGMPIMVIAMINTRYQPSDGHPHPSRNNPKDIQN
jgi:hypothetical protein